MIGQTTQTPAGFENAMMRFQASGVAGNTQTPSPKNMEAIEKTAKEFESVFLSQMLSHMFEGLETDGMFSGGSAEKIYRSMMVNEYSKQISDGGGLGIADNVAQYMLRVQEEGV